MEGELNGEMFMTALRKAGIDVKGKVLSVVVTGYAPEADRVGVTFTITRESDAKKPLHG